MTAAERGGMRVSVALCVVVLMSGCGEAEEPAAPAASSDPGLIHVHGLGRNPADGALMVATHTGLFRVRPDTATPKRVAGNFQDTMGFTIVGPDAEGDDGPSRIQLAGGDET